MSKENSNNNSKIRHESLGNLDLLVLWSEYGNNGSSIIREKIQSDSNQSIEENKSNATNKVVLFGSLAVLALLSVAAWIQTPKINQAVQEAGRSSIEQLTLTPY